MIPKAVKPKDITSWSTKQKSYGPVKPQKKHDKEIHSFYFNLSYVKIFIFNKRQGGHQYEKV